MTALTTRRPPLNRVNYDNQGLARSISFFVLPCSAEPRETFIRRAAN